MPAPLLPSMPLSATQAELADKRAVKKHWLSAPKTDESGHLVVDAVEVGDDIFLPSGLKPRQFQHASRPWSFSLKQARAGILDSLTGGKRYRPGAVPHDLSLETR